MGDEVKSTVAKWCNSIITQELPNNLDCDESGEKKWMPVGVRNTVTHCDTF